MNLLALRTLVKTNFPSTYGSAGGLVDQWINFAYHELLDAYAWPSREAAATFACVNAQQTYTLVGTSPVVPDFAGLISVRCNTAAGGSVYPKLEIMDQDVFDRISTAPATGAPAIYTLRGGTPAANAAAMVAGGQQQMAFFPTPDAAYTVQLRYFRSVDSAELSADTDVPLLPARLHGALAFLAAALGYEWENQADAAISLRRSAQQRVAEAITQTERMRRGAEMLDVTPGAQYPPGLPQQPERPGAPVAVPQQQAV